MNALCQPRGHRPGRPIALDDPRRGAVACAAVRQPLTGNAAACGPNA